MKNMMRSLPAKITCFILCIFSLIITAASVFGITILISAEVYTTTEGRLIESATRGEIYNDAYNIMNYYVSEDTAYKHFHSERDFSKDATNLRYQLVDAKGNIVAKNTESFDGNWQYVRSFEAYTDEEGNMYFEDMGEKVISSKENAYVFYAFLEESLPVDDEYAFICSIVRLGYSLRYSIYVIALLSLVLSVVCFAILMTTAARKPHTDKLFPGVLHKVPLDLIIAVLIAVFTFAVYLATDVFYTGEAVVVASLIALAVAAAYVLLGICMSISARIKDRSLFKNTVIFRILKVLIKILKVIARGLKTAAGRIRELFLAVPLIWRTLLIVAVISFIEFIVIINSWWQMENLAVFWVIEKLIFIPATVYAALFLRKLQKGGEALAKGDLAHQVDTKIMFWDFRKHGENLNSISQGMATAVEQRLQSERMKAELITNVSHDIKTPLTSIINYAGLINEETCDCEHHAEYSEVLIRKSEHLKRLLEDLVEVSKATTGNLDIKLSACDAGVLLTQTAGEFEQRCAAAELELVTIRPDKSIRIMADSRRIWRVFENLMSNACKYSLPRSRVYLSLEQIGNDAVFTFRNTSYSPLNISADELTERFVRGDSSRSTEGNGLGLSIAQSLTELQNGKMDITIDGDLFKVTLKFPMI